MKQYHVFLVLAVLMSMVGTKAFAYDVKAENEDGVTIFYKYINDNTELEVVSDEYPYYYYYKGDVVIPESVTILNRTRKVTSIGSRAFNGCSSLSSVTIPGSVTSIGDYAFHECSGLSSVTIPSSVTSIGDDAFSGCSGLSSVTIPSSVTSIGNYAFSGCKGLSSVTIPSSVTSIGSFAFRYCSGLKKVIVKDLAAWCNISFGDNPLYYAHHLYVDENTEITDLVIPDGVTSIGSEAFYGCSGLSSVTIPSSVTTIGSWAFRDCSGLKKVIVKDLAAWCNLSFSVFSSNPLEYAHHLYIDEDTEITDLAIPEGVTSIGDFAFSGCSGLSSVTIPEGVTSIGSYAFSGCSSLSSVTIPEGVTSIGSEAFGACSGLSFVTIPASVTSIGSYAFGNCKNLATIVSFIEEPSSTLWAQIFDNFTLNNATLYVPQGTTEKYKAAKYWKDFVWIEEGMPAGIKLPANENVESAGVLRYAPDGRRLAEPKRGLNIMKMPDGKTKKVIIK